MVFSAAVKDNSPFVLIGYLVNFSGQQKVSGLAFTSRFKH